MAKDNSDYKKPRTNLFDLLPGVYQSDVNKSVLENVHNRFLSKTELEKVVGTIGIRNRVTQFNTQISEPSVHRQGYQLQPLLYTKIATVNYATAHKDILRKSEQLGIDTDRFPKWGNVTKFNFAPPIDLDKIVNFSDYYWYDPENPTSVPQYVTIKNKCTVAKAKTHQKQLELNDVGYTHAIVGVNATLDTFSVQNDSSKILVPGTNFTVTGSSSNDGTWTVLEATFDAFSNKTTIKTVEDITDDVSINGTINYQIIVDQLIEEQNCICTGASLGWDARSFDDNGGDWDPTDDWEVAGAPEPEGIHTWDETSNCVTQTDVEEWSSENKWVHRLDLPALSVAKRAEMPIIEYSPDLQMNKWSYTKPKWLYRSTLVSEWEESDTEPTLTEINVRYSIVDVDSSIDTFVVDGDQTGTLVPGFQFTVEGSDCFDGYWTVSSATYSAPNTLVVVQETINDNLSCDAFVVPSSLINGIDPANNTFRLPGNYTFALAPSTSFVVQGAGSLNGTYTSATATFDGTNTTVGTVEDIVLPTDSVIVPLVATSKGDPWKGFFQHWVYDGVKNTVPIDFQTPNASIDSEEFIINSAKQPFSFSGDILELVNPVSWVTGDEVVLSTEGELPSPIFTNEVYYVVRLNSTQFRLSLTREDALTTPTPVTMTFSGTDSGQHYVRLTNREFTLTSLTYLADTNSIRVYVDDVRQYGSYQEGIYVSDNPDTVVAGDWIIDTINIQENDTVDSVLFAEPLPEFAIVRIETNAAAEADVGYEQALVRTTTNDSYTAEIRSLIRYRLVEQTKSEHTQYPLFDIFNIDGTTAFRASPIFAFQESPTSSPDSRVGNRRIVISSTQKEFYFEQFLLDEDDGKIYCYIDVSSIDTDNLTGLQTIWRTGKVDGEFIEYVPRYVNADRLADGDVFINDAGQEAIASVPPGSGDWEVPDTLFYNSLHENRKVLTLSQLVTHFQSMINAQIPYSGYSGSQANLYRTLLIPNYGLGGLIKEFNDGYDNFLSALYVTSGTPLSIIEFAHDQYENGLNTLEEYFKKHAIDLLTNLESAYLADLSTAVADNIISTFELNEAQSLVFGDSNTYNKETGEGVKNWIATLPFVKLAFKRQPEFFYDKKRSIVEILHHDGHRSQVTLQGTLFERVLSYLLNTNYPTSADKWATQGLASAIPSDPSEVKVGEYYYATNTKVLYRFSVVAISSLPPSSTFAEGTLWLRSSDGMLMFRDTSNPTNWSPVNGTPGDIGDAWKVISLPVLFAGTVEELETRLYEAAPDLTELAFDFDSLTPDNDEQGVYDTYLEDAFLEYARQHNISDPYATGYVNSNAFTWNYKNVDHTTPGVVNYPTTATLADKPWGSVWQTINELIFGTPYPHLEPWKLQGYTDKPDWWNDQYAWTTNTTRRWDPAMWTNLSDGIVPAGELLPDGVTLSTGASGEVTQYTRFSVNITSGTTTDGYGPDDLIPPYWTAPTGGATDLAVADQALISVLNDVVDPDDGYVFGEIGPIEYVWRKSSQYLYDLLTVAFRMQPVRFLHNTFGEEYTLVGNLQVNNRTQKPFSHRDVIFHGEFINNETFVSLGVNQWYTNFHRYNAFDVRASNFRNLWTGWVPTFAYQMGTFIDTKSFIIQARYFDVIEQDFNIITKVVPGIDDFWLDSLQITATVLPPKTFHNDDQSGWEFRINTPTPVSRPLTYYGVRNFKFTVNTTSNVCTLADLETLPWTSGTQVFVNASVTLPVPLETQTPYFITVLNNTQFTLSETPDGPAIDLTSVGSGDVYVGEVKNTFVALDGGATDIIWNHFVIDKRRTITVTAPFTITGTQNVVNVIDGYVSYLTDQGFVFNDSSRKELDPDTNRLVDWQVETERFIDYMYGIRAYNFSTTSEPIVSPTTEINPFRNNIWFANELGIISNVSAGPYQDIHTEQTIYDQYGRLIGEKLISVFRLDTLGHITLDPEIPNDVQPSKDPYQFLHIGGIHLFVDGYEHTILFNEYTVDGNLIYDPFLGLNTERFRVQFYRQPTFTQRPNVGGYFFNDNNLLRNFEGTVEDMQQIYDTFNANESSILTQYARNLLGYKEPEYLDHLGIDPKSKFIFWRGLIQNKGSINSVKAFINSRKFVDAKIDEFWAYKVAEFGDAREKRYPEIKLNVEDAIKDILRLQFTTTNVDNSLEEDFVDIQTTDQTRWFDYPDQVGTVNNGSQNLYFDTEVSVTLTDPSPIATTSLFPLSVPCDDVNVVFDKGYAKNAYTASGSAVFTAPDYITGANNLVVYVNGVETNDYTETGSGTTITFNTTPTVGAEVVIVRKPGVLPKGTGPGYYSMVNSKLVKITNYADLGTFTIYGLNAAKSKLNPSKLIDYKSDVVIDVVPFWDPAKGVHFYTADAVITLKDNNDPAKYTTTLSESVDAENAWNAAEEGIVWMDTSELGYVPYHDKQIFTNVEDRIQRWGSLASWADVNIYEWTASVVPPSDWASQVAEQEGDISIAEEDRASGVAKSVVFKRTRDNDTFTIDTWNLASHAASLDSTLYAKINANDTTGLTFTSYSAVVTINGSPITLYIDGNRAQTFGELIKEINNDLTGTATATLSDNQIVITGNDTTTETLVISDVDLFASLEKNGTPTFLSFTSNVDAQNSIITLDNVGDLTLTEGMSVFLKTDGTLPAPLKENTKYFIIDIDGDFGLSETEGGAAIKVTNSGSGTFTIMNSVFTDDNLWTKNVNEHDEFIVHAALSTSVSAQLTNTNIESTDLVSVYVNGYFVDELLVSSLPTFIVDYDEQDIVHIVKKKHEPSDEELAFDPSVEDDGSFVTQYKEDFEYVIINSVDPRSGDTVSVYYFWVKDKMTRGHGRTLSLKQAKDVLLDPNSPFMFTQNLLKTEATSDIAGKTVVYPDRYSQVVIKGLATKIKEDERYKFRFTRDFTLRDTLEDALTPNSLKNVHSEWQLFREKQPFNVPRALWDKLTEALAGYELDTIGTANPIPVPAPSRIMYDSIYDTSTRFGLRSGQAFTDRDLSLSSILSILEDSNFDLAPLNKEDFLATHSFDTPADIKETMDYMYNNFTFEQVNTLFFAGLMDAFSLKVKYPDVFKTSMIALHGIRILETAGSVTDF